MLKALIRILWNPIMTMKMQKFEQRINTKSMKFQLCLEETRWTDRQTNRYEYTTYHEDEVEVEMIRRIRKAI